MSIWDEDEEYLLKIYAYEFATQDEWALKSEVFRKILNSEIKEDPKERYTSTNSSRSKTRNALIARHAFQNTKEWEEDLLNTPFYWE